MVNNKYNFEKAIMEAYTDIFKRNALYALIAYVKDCSYKRETPGFVNVHQSMINGLEKLNQCRESLPYSFCLTRIEEAIDDAIENKENMDITASIILDVYKTTNGCQVPIFLLKKIGEYIQEPCRQDGASLAEVLHIIVNTFYEVNPDATEIFRVSLYQPYDIEAFYKSEIQACVDSLSKIAESKVCLKSFFYLINEKMGVHTNKCMGQSANRVKKVKNENAMVMMVTMVTMPYLKYGD